MSHKSATSKKITSSQTPSLALPSSHLTQALSALLIFSDTSNRTLNYACTWTPEKTHSNLSKKTSTVMKFTWINTTVCSRQMPFEKNYSATYTTSTTYQHAVQWQMSRRDLFGPPWRLTYKIGHALVSNAKNQRLHDTPKPHLACFWARNDLHTYNVMWLDHYRHHRVIVIC